MNDEANRSLAQHDAPEQTAVRLKMGRLSRLAWLPIPVLLATMVALRAADLRTSHESLNLLISLNFIFSTLASLAVAFLMGRAFLLWPSPGMLMVGCGVLIWGVGSFVATLVGRGNANVIVTIHNLCVWLAACSHLAGVSFSGRLRDVVAAPRLWVGAAYTLSLGLVWLVAQAVLTGWMPVYFVQGQGGTLVRQFVLSSAVSMLVLTAMWLRSVKGRPWSAFAYWYSLALLLLATGLFGVMIQSAHGSLLGWTGWAAQFLGGAYMIVAAFASARETSIASIWPATVSGGRRQRYLVAIVITIVAAALRLAFLQTLGTSVRFITFYPAVMLSALYGGLGPGVLATVLSALLATYLWIEPVSHFFPVSSAESMGIAIFFINCTAISWIIEVMRRAQVRTHKAEMQARIADERERAAQVLQQSEAKYRSLFENMINGFAYHKIITDKNGKPVDYIFLEVNNAFEALTGLKRMDVVGKRVTEVLHGIENDPADWIGKYGNVALTGGELRFEQYAASLDKWYSILSFSPTKDYFVAIFEDITERKRADKALRENEERLAADLDAMTRLQKVGTLFVCEDNLEPVLGEIVDAAIAISGADFGNIQLLDPTSSTLQIVAQRGFPKWWIDFWNRVSEGKGTCGTALERGECVIVEDIEQSPIFTDTPALEIQLKAGVRAVQSTPLVSRSGRPLGMFSTHYKAPHRPDDRILRLLDMLARHAADIIERGQTDDALRRSEERFRIIASSTPDHLLVQDRDLRYTFILNPQLGLTEQDMIGKTDHDILAKEDAEKLTAIKLKVLQTGKPVRVEVPLISRDGESKFFDGSYVPMFDAQGRVDGLIGYFRNITESKRVEMELERMRGILSEGQRIAHLGSWEYIADTQETVWSEEELRIYGLDPTGPSPDYQDMLRSNIHPDDAAMLDQTFRQALREGAVFELEHRIVRPDGIVRVVYDLAHPYFDEKGKLVRYVGTTLDITQRKQTEEALQRSRAELEERVKERTRELADSQEQLRNLYSHLQSLREEERTNIAREIHDDLGQTLTALKMDLSWIAGKLRDDNEGLKEKLNADVDQVDKAIQAVKSVCTELRPGILDHLGLAAALEWQAEAFQKRTGIKCEVVCEPEDIEVDTRLRTPLFRIFQEALTNILKHAKATEVKASLTQTRSSIILEIADDGIGITEEDLSKLGSFGLLGMRERVYPWGGKVTVSGVKNKGTTVKIIIPVTSGEPS